MPHIPHRLTDPADPYLLWVMLNPSTADDDADDPTIRKVRGFTRRHGYSAFRVCNLYSATQPRGLWALNHAGADYQLEKAAAAAGAIVVAWGNHGAGRLRVTGVERILGRAGVPVLRVGDLTAEGQPRHPSRAPYSLGLVPHPIGEPK